MNTLMNTFTPRTAIEAARLIRCTEASFKLDAAMFWNGDNTLTMYSAKVVDGKRIRSAYEVDLNKGTCTCPDFSANKLFCKHIIKAERTAADMEAETAQEALLSQMDEEAANCEGAYPW